MISVRSKPFQLCIQWSLHLLKVEGSQQVEKRLAGGQLSSLEQKWNKKDPAKYIKDA